MRHFGATMWIALLAVLYCCRLDVADAMQMRLHRNKETCIAHLSEHQGEEIVVHYSAQRLNTNGFLDAVVKVKDTKKIIQRQELSTKHLEMFTFVSPTVAWFLICFTNHEPPEEDSNPFHLYVRVESMQPSATDDDEYDVPITLDDYGPKFSAVHWQLKALRDNTEVLEHRQTEFEHTASNTYGRVLLMTIINAGVLVGAAIWQTVHLRQFFREKKVV